MFPDQYASKTDLSNPDSGQIRATFPTHVPHFPLNELAVALLTNPLGEELCKRCCKTFDMLFANC
jgi:hypothetical protein